MFYARYLKLCAKAGSSPSKVALECGFNKGSVSVWKKKFQHGEDVKPTSDILVKLADYFGVTVDYLLGNEKTSAENGEGNKSNYNIFAKNGITGMHDETTDNEQSDKLAELILATRELPPEKIDMLIKMAESIK